ncbi:MAG: uracil-DNA glycosylase, partial [Marmoricola sp.]
MFPSPVPPGAGWPGDPIAPGDPVPLVARSATGVARLASRAPLPQLEARISVCAACPRLVSWREQVARDKRASYAGESYWGRPIAG